MLTARARRPISKVAPARAGETPSRGVFATTAPGGPVPDRGGHHGSGVAASAHSFARLGAPASDTEPASPVAGAAPVQRLAWVSDESRLYTSNGWQDLSEKIEVAKSGGTGTEEVTRKISDYIADDQLKTALFNHWGVDLWSGEVKTVGDLDVGWIDAAKYVDLEKKLRDKIVGTKRAERREKLKAFLANETVTGGLVKPELDRVEVEQEIRDTWDELGRTAEAGRQRARQRVNENYYLYKTEKALELFNSRGPVAKPVYNPVIYMEADAGTSIKSDFVKLTSCVLLSMVYEAGAGGTGKKQAQERIEALAEKVGIDKPSLKKGDFYEDLRLKNEKLYETVGSLHAYFKNQEGIDYDLDKNVEQVMTKAGYKMVVSCNCAWSDLPAALPLGYTLRAGVYIFGIEGHNNAVKVKQDITADTVIGKLGDYFQAYNESTDNYDKTPTLKNVRNIWART